MSYKLKRDSIDLFSKEMAAEVCDQFFNENVSVDGNQLMGITGSKQTNLLLVRTLFGKWQEETKKLKSPYFHFENDEVQRALEVFMKVLSKYIRVERGDLEPLLENAISDSLILHFEPALYFSERLLANVELEISIEELKELKKYLKINADSLHAMIKTLKGDGISREDLVDRINEVYTETSLKTIDPIDFLKELNAESRLEDLFEEEVEVKVDEPEEEVILEPVKDEQILEVAESDDTAALNEKFNKSQKTLVDELQKKVGKDIESSLTLNEKFMFINNLFSGDKDGFKSALKDLEASTNFNDAKLKVVNQYGSDWDMEAEEAEAFLEVLERRFA